MRGEIRTKQQSRVSSFLRQLPTLPLSALRLSRGKRLLIVALTYGLGIPGLWLFLPLVHSAVSMLLPIICICWFFRYRGLLISIPSMLGALWLIYVYLSPYALTPGQTFGGRAVIGFGLGFLFGLITCWLRTAFDLVQAARSRALVAEQERLQAEYAERQTKLAYEHQREINELKDQFLLHVSHELSTPLTTLGGALELLQREDHEHQDAKLRAYLLTLAVESHEALVSLVKRILDTTKVVSEILQVQSEVVCLHQLVQEELATLPHDKALAYTIHVQVSEEIMVWADPQLLRQVLRSLLSNIFKYVPTQTEIHIEATQATPSSPVCLSVQDAGPGIPPEEQPLLFEKFARLKRDLAGTIRGTGLGLYICKRLVEAMDGRIWVESSGRPGEGSRFCVSLHPFSGSSLS